MFATRARTFLAALCGLCLVAAGQLWADDAKPAAPAAPPPLIIIKAVYGDLPDGQKIDVTDKVKALVKDSALTVDATNENFTDPAEGTAKKLQVDYKFGADGKPLSKTVDENATLTISWALYQAANDPKMKLTIIKAVYGDLPDGQKIDVTDKVKALVQDNCLTVAATNENFTDPAEGTGKKLHVDYKYGDGATLSKECAETETLTIMPPQPVDPNAVLVIRKAVYGDLPDGPKVDVTDKVRAMVKNNQLSVDATNDNFGDPANGTQKKLTVDYTFKGVDKSKTVDENDTLTINDKGE
jgi:hypothetical protein